MLSLPVSGCGVAMMFDIAFGTVPGEQETGPEHRISTEVLLGIISKPISFLVYNCLVHYLKFFLLIYFLFERERERERERETEHEWGRGAEGGRERLSSRLHAQHQTRCGA